MKKTYVVLAALLCASLATAAGAADTKTVAEVKKPAASGKKPQVTKEKTTKITATVEAIDLASRVVTLKGPQGNVFDITAGEQVKNLAQVKVGDLVHIVYYESVAVKVFKPGEITHGTTTDVGAERLAKPGEKPAGVVAAQVTLTATVESISPKKESVTLKKPDGTLKVVRVEDKRNLENVHVGDDVMITFTESMAVAVTPAKKK